MGNCCRIPSRQALSHLSADHESVQELKLNNAHALHHESAAAEDSHDGPSSAMKSELLAKFPELHPAVLELVIAEASKQTKPSHAYDQISELIELCSGLTADDRNHLARGDEHTGSTRLPGGKTQPGAYAAMKQHAGEVDRTVRKAKCLRTMRLMGAANMIMEEAKLVLLEIYPSAFQFDKLEGEANGTARSASSSIRMLQRMSSLQIEENKVTTTTYVFKLSQQLDREGRPIYENRSSKTPDKAFLAWHQGKFGGHWSVCTDRHGKAHGDQGKWSALPFDKGGHWTTPPEADTRAMAMASRLSKVSSSMSFDEFGSVLSDCIDIRPTVTRLISSAVSNVKFCQTVREYASKVFFNSQEDLIDMGVSWFLGWPPQRRARIVSLLRYLIRGIVMINGVEDEACQFEKMNTDDDCDDDLLRYLLTRLASYAQLIEGDNWEKQLARELPGFPFEISYVQLMILNCRLFGMSRIRSRDYPMTLIRLHDFVFRAWQIGRVSVGPSEMPKIAVRYLDMKTQELRTLPEAPVQPKNCLRFVVVSDTHGWKLALSEAVLEENTGCGRIVLPKGDILLHCGDLLNEGMTLCDSENFVSDGSVAYRDEKLTEELQHLASLGVERNTQGSLEKAENAERQSKFKWIFLVGGNHDAPLHMLASCGRLKSHLGKSVVLLQSPAEFDHPNPFKTEFPKFVHSAAQSTEIQSSIVNGAVRVLEDCTLCSPYLKSGEGLVLAGSGLSLANNAWSANRAFQIQRQDQDKLRFAADQLVASSPDILMTHGPPAGYADEKRGDEFLRSAVDGSSAKVHFFGHAHSNGLGTDDHAWKLHGHTYPGRCFVNASIVTSFYLPTRLPIVVDLPVHSSASEIDACPTEDTCSGERPDVGDVAPALISSSAEPDAVGDGVPAPISPPAGGCPGRKTRPTRKSMDVVSSNISDSER